LLKGFDQVLLVVAPQPGGSTVADQLPDQMESVCDSRAAVNHVAAEHQMVSGREHGQELDQGGMTAVHITDHPVTLS
jgi:hypothetical protein